MSDPILEVNDLRITFRSHDRVTEAVKGISFSMEEGRTMAVVGESGSGKSVTAMSLTQLLPPRPACEVTGEVLYQPNGERIDLLKLGGKAIRKFRGKDIAYVFQEPSSSLNPVFTVGYQIAEAIKLHLPEVKDVRGRVIESLDRVGIRDPEVRYKAYPHEMSGGMNQRVMIAMALACEPRILIADEPTTALDVTIQKQIMDLLKKLKAELNMTIILITHNFGIVKGFADDVTVMYKGDIVEHGPTDEVLVNPQHLYTQSLLACIPTLDKQVDRLTTIDHDKLAAYEAQRVKA